jgi:chromosome segregation ATPase
VAAALQAARQQQEAAALGRGGGPPSRQNLQDTHARLAESYRQHQEKLQALQEVLQRGGAQMQPLLQPQVLETVKAMQALNAQMQSIQQQWAQQQQQLPQ